MSEEKNRWSKGRLWKIWFVDVGLFIASVVVFATVSNNLVENLSLASMIIFFAGMGCIGMFAMNAD